MDNRSLGDIATELEGLEDVIALVSLFVAPAERPINGSTPTQETIDGAFHSICETLRHIREEVNEWEGKYITLKRQAADNRQGDSAQ